MCVAALVLLSCFPSGRAAACPFCNAVQPTLAQQRESAAIVALGEFSVETEGQQRFNIHQTFKGTLPAAQSAAIDLFSSEPRRRGQLALLFATGGEDDTADLAWRAVDVDETALGYFIKSPTLRTPAAERLRYFARALQHPNATIAEDAYLEFGHAAYDDVAKVADALESDRLRAWLADEQVPQHRKGFYALALGLPRDPESVAANRQYLERLIVEPASDFRAGFDGVLGAYLLAGGEPALDLIVERMLRPTDAPEGDTRHAIKAVRFYQEFGRAIPPARLAAAIRPLLARPSFAAEAIADLARWQDWESLPEVVAQYAVESPFQQGTRVAVVGYLTACPKDEAATALAQLRATDPTGVTAALDLLGL